MKMEMMFIAVQCFNCSTMQVKQRKKSSNKWTCVVCDQNQSVRKVFSHAYMAKDVRKVVQSFNMSRQFIQQQQELLGDEEIEVGRSAKRTDWTEYIDPPDFHDDDQGDLCEPNVVTELPKPLFKKPKLRDNYSAAGLDCEDGSKLRRPVFGKRNVKKKINDPDKEPKAIGKENYKRGGENQLIHNYADKELGGISSKWGEYNKVQPKDNVDHSFAYKATSSIMSKFKRPACENVSHGFTNIGSSSMMTKMKRPASKWNDFLDDDNDLELEIRRCEEVNNAAFERKVYDEIVEDDVHPDFL